MTQSQVEIKAIQAKLQAIQAGRSTPLSPKSSPSTPSTIPMPMVELTPNRATRRETPEPSVAQSQHSDPARIAANLQQRSLAYLQQLQQIPTHPDTPEPARDFLPKEMAINRLEAQIQHINGLSAVQEVAMLELKAIAERLEQDWRAAEVDRNPLTTHKDVPVICQYLAATVPHIEQGEDGSYVLTTRDVDLFQREREASLMAHTLRQRTPKPASRTNRTGKPSRRPSSGLTQDVAMVGQTLWKSVGAVVRSLSTAKPHAPSLKTARTQASQAAELPDFSLQDAMLWVLGAIVVRVGLDLLLIANPGLWLPVVGVIITPAAIAVYRATVTPQFGFIWGYRLLLIMIGLLIGGRLY